MYLELQVWVVSHVNQQAVEGGQAPRLGHAAGTPWTGVTYNNKFTFRQHKHRDRKISCTGAVMYVLFEKWIQV